MVSLSSSEGSEGKRSPATKQRTQPKKKNFKKHRGTYSPTVNRELNSKIVQQENAQELLQILASTKGALTNVGGGGALNSINFSTALHRIGRHLAFAWQNPKGNDRSRILSDPRFALIVCSAAEALGGADVKDTAGQKLEFGARELSNIAWAIAKLQIAPPKNVVAVDATSSAEESLISKSNEVRTTIYEVAKNRAQTNNKAQSAPWIPALSELCGHVMDTISYRATLLNPNQFRLQEFANLLWATATAKRSDEKVFTFVISCLMKGMKGRSSEALRPQEWSNSIWALATSGVIGPERDLLPFVADLMDNNPGFIDDFKPQELSNTVWGIATILSKRAGHAEGSECDAALRIFRNMARELIKRGGEGYKSQEITNSIWSLATTGFGVTNIKNSDSTRLAGNDYTFLISSDVEGDQQLMEEALQVAFEYAKKNIRRFRSQELNNLAWTMARLGQRDDELLEMIGRELINPRRKVSSQDIGTTLWSMATLEYFNADLYRQIVSRVNREKAGYCKPQELSNALWALATADVIPEYIDTFDMLLVQRSRTSPAKAESDPVVLTIALAARELMRRPNDFKTQEIKDILWALSRLGVRYPALFKSVAEHLVGPADDPEISGRGLADFSQQGIGNLAWAFARQAQLGAEVVARRDKDTVVQSVSGRLAHYTISFVDVGETLLQKLFYEIAEVDLKVHGNLSKLSPQDLANTAWAFAILGMKHTQFLTALVDQIKIRLERYIQGDRRNTYFNGQELANALWALASLNWKGPGLLSSIESYLLNMIGKPSLKNIIKFSKRQELANIAWACAVFGEYPTRLIELLYMGLLGIGDKSDPEYLHRHYKDGGIQSSAVMSIVYLQTIMGLELPDHSFSLPSDFPEQWGAVRTPKQSLSTTRNPNDMLLLEDDTFELQLKSSKIQLSVGEALGRIGFNHVQEHVIDMEALVNEYGLKMACNPKEILSLDIAQVDSQIGVEVDGPGHFITNIDEGSCAHKQQSYSNTLNGKVEYQFKWSYDYQEPNGPTALKTRMLKRLGWEVINLPFWEWYALESNAQGEEDYCRSILPE